MSNGWKLELLPSDAINRAYLNFWDALHGEDEVFVLLDDQAYRQVYNENADEFDLEPVNLVEALLALKDRLQGR